MNIIALLFEFDDIFSIDVAQMPKTSNFCQAFCVGSSLISRNCFRFVETSRQFGIAKLSIRKLGSSSALELVTSVNSQTTL